MFGRHAFFRTPWRDRPFQRGDLKYVILGLIRDKPRYGYEIIRALEERSHGFYTPSAGTVYPTLQMLEEMGYVTSDQQDGKKVYTITDEGRRFLEERGEAAEQVSSQMRDHWNPRNMMGMAEMMRECGRLSGLVTRRARWADQDRMKRIHEAITRACNDIERIIDE